MTKSNLARIVLVWTALAAVTVRADDNPPAAWSAVRDTMQQYVDRHQISGAVTLVASPDRVLALDAVGSADIAAAKPMAADTIFALASMTKPVTATAFLMLYDDGKLSLDDTVGKYIPELAHLKTSNGAEHIVTLRQLLTHTSGLAEAAGDRSRSARTLAELIPAFADQPLQFAPGTKWKYCQSGMNTLARIIEVVSGRSFPDFLQDRLFTPLGMKDTTFYPTKDQIPRIARSYRMIRGQLQESPTPIISTHNPAARDYYPAAHAGLFSTAPDYGRFARMVLSDGTLDGRHYLKPETVRLMSTLQTADLDVPHTPGAGWGLGWCVLKHPQGINAMLPTGAFGHGGAYGTQVWIDPRKQLAFILMVQRADFNNNDPKNVRIAFQRAVAAVAYP